MLFTINSLPLTAEIRFCLDTMLLLWRLTQFTYQYYAGTEHAQTLLLFGEWRAVRCQLSHQTCYAGADCMLCCLRDHNQIDWFKFPVVNNIFHNTLRWRHNGRDSVSNHQPHDCLLNRLFRRTSKRTSKFRVTGLCAGNSSGTGELPTQMASNADYVSIWWRHHEYIAVTHLS